jgi:hypothetical protein
MKTSAPSNKATLASIKEYMKARAHAVFKLDDCIKQVSSAIEQIQMPSKITRGVLRRHVDQFGLITNGK